MHCLTTLADKLIGYVIPFRVGIRDKRPMPLMSHVNSYVLVDILFVVMVLYEVDFFFPFS